VGAFWISAAVVFVAELGDKSQLLALMFATRYRAVPVLAGITAATTLVHGVSVGIGHGLGATLPTDWIAAIAGVTFLGVAIWTIRGDTLTADEERRALARRGSAMLAVGVAFFLAELGDKTMLATVALATQHGWLATWAGSTVGMVAADGLALAVGHQIGRKVPERVVAVACAALFAVFGVWILAESVPRLLA
jgi:putative Ca2+/H+ antiporter (TMEM165/GDT1 family)